MGAGGGGGQFQGSVRKGAANTEPPLILHPGLKIQNVGYTHLDPALCSMPNHSWQDKWNREMEWGGWRGGKQGQTGDKSINRNLLRNSRLGIQKFKGQDQSTSSQFNSQAIYIVISGTVYSENTPGSTLLVLFHANKFWHFIKDLSDAYIFLFQLSTTWD